MVHHLQVPMSSSSHQNDLFKFGEMKSRDNGREQYIAELEAKIRTLQNAAES